MSDTTTNETVSRSQAETFYYEKLNHIKDQVARFTNGSAVDAANAYLKRDVLGIADADAGKTVQTAKELHGLGEFLVKAGESLMESAHFLAGPGVDLDGKTEGLDGTETEGGEGHDAEDLSVDAATPATQDVTEKPRRAAASRPSPNQPGRPCGHTPRSCFVHTKERVELLKSGIEYTLGLAEQMVDLWETGTHIIRGKYLEYPVKIDPVGGSATQEFLRPVPKRMRDLADRMEAVVDELGAIVRVAAMFQEEEAGDQEKEVASGQEATG